MISHAEEEYIIIKYFTFFCIFIIKPMRCTNFSNLFFK